MVLHIGVWYNQQIHICTRVNRYNLSPPPNYLFLLTHTHVQAYRRGMIYPRYLFISYYWYPQYWWTFPILRGTPHTYTPENCTVRELTDAIFRSLAVDYFPLETGPRNESTDVGTVSQASTKYTPCKEDHKLAFTDACFLLTIGSWNITEVQLIAGVTFLFMLGFIYCWNPMFKCI